MYSFHVQEHIDLGPHEKDQNCKHAKHIWNLC